MAEKTQGRAGRRRPLWPPAKRGARAKRPLSGQLALTLLLALCMVAGIYLIEGIWPFGDGTVMTGDLGGQYLPYYAHYRTRWGESLGYALDKGLGGGMLGLFAYYVASPLNLIYLLLPVESYAAAAGGVLAAKLVLACLSFCFYAARRFAGLGEFAVPLSLCYGFMAYDLVYAQNIMWLDGVILLPLVLAGLDRLMAGRSALPFTLTLAAAIFCNFYIGYMLCLFCALYLVFSQLAARRPLRAAGRAMGRLIAAGVTAASLCGALLLPAVLDAQATKGSLLGSLGSGVRYPLQYLACRFTFAPFLWEEIKDGGLPNLYCGCFALVLCLCFFVSDRITRREKLCGGGLLGVLVACSWLTPLDNIWHGFKQPVWFPCRYSFLISFTVLLLAAALLARGPVRASRLALAGLLGLVGSVFVYRVRLRSATELKLLVTAGFCLGFLVLLLFWARSAAGQNGLPDGARRLAALAAAGVCAAELCVAGALTLRKFERYTNSEYRAFVAGGRAVAAAVQAADGGLYRMEKTYNRAFNDPMLLGYRGISHYGSTQGALAPGLLDRLGYYPNLYRAGSSPAGDALLGLRYIFTRPGDPPPNSVLRQSGVTAPAPVYENPYRLPFFRLCGLQLLQLEAQDAFALQNGIFAALAGGGGGQVLAPVELEQIEDGFAFTCPQAGSYYWLAQGRGEGPLLVDGEEIGDYFGYYSYAGRVQELGRFEAGQRVTVQLPAAAVESARVALLDEPLLAEICARQAARAPEYSFDAAAARLQVAARTRAPCLLLSALVYDGNWQARVNGEEVQPVCVGQGFLAVPLPAGESRVELRYRPRGQAAGWALTGLGAALLAAGGLAERQRKKQEGQEGRG